MAPMGKDALQRCARQAAEQLAKEREMVRWCGPDLGVLEPCPYCGQAICNPALCPDDPQNDGGNVNGPVDVVRRAATVADTPEATKMLLKVAGALEAAAEVASGALDELVEEQQRSIAAKRAKRS